MVDEWNGSAKPSIQQSINPYFEFTMKTTRQFLLVAAVSALLGACSRNQPPETPQTIIPDKLRAAGAQTLKFPAPSPTPPANPWPARRWSIGVTREVSFGQTRPEMEKQITTGADGAFGLQVSRGTGFFAGAQAGLGAGVETIGPEIQSVIREAGNKSLC